MAQFIDIQYQEKAESKPINQRFLDITGPSVLSGFRLFKGATDFNITLARDGYKSSVAITPSGARVEESADLDNILTVRPNDVLKTYRVDSVYLRYVYGTPTAIADYVIVEGTHIPAENPNIRTHLLLGYVYVPANGEPLKNSNLVSIPYGFSSLTVAGKTTFNGEVGFTQDVVFKANVIFEGGVGRPDANTSLIQKLPIPIIATEGQTTFTLPSSYTMNKNALFPYRNEHLAPPSDFVELTPTTFRFLEPCKEGDIVWAFWFDNIQIIAPKDHNHDDLYYRKWEVAARLVRYATDFFAGTIGRRIPHGLNINSEDYVVLAVTPTEKNADVGVISTEKRQNEIYVYNTGTYRGKFDISYLVKYNSVAENISQLGDFTVESNQWNEQANAYEEVIYRRKDGTISTVSRLSMPDPKGRLTRMTIEEYNDAGTMVINEKIWAFTYSSNSNTIEFKTRVK